MKNQLKILNKVFKEDEKISIQFTKPDERGHTKPILKYNGKGFMSPSKMLSYKSKQIYDIEGVPFDAYVQAVERANTYHRLFESINNGFILKTLPDKQIAFTKAIQTFYNKYNLTPIVGEYILWSEHNHTMCICDAIAMDKDGNYVVLELKTMEALDLKKELLSHFQTYTAKTILEKKLDVKNVKAYTLRWSHKNEELTIKVNQLEFSELTQHFQSIINTEGAWNNKIDELKEKRNKKKESKDLLAKLRERNGTNK